jgi:hypothetical protein
MAERPISAASFYAFLREGKLMASRCISTGRLYLPPRAISPDTFGDDMEWVELSGRGKLAAFTAVHFGLSRMAGYDAAHPYCTGIVELDEGPRISALILGVDAAHPETIPIGLPLNLDRSSTAAGADQMLVFRP